MTDHASLDQRSRAELLEEARRLGVERPERMTRVELRDEILRLTTSGEKQAEARGLFGVARAMLASVVEGGLNLPDAAAVIRGTSSFDARVRPTAPVATVTLAEIYAAQGHKERALQMLEEVLRVEPDHEIAGRLRANLRGESSRPAGRNVEAESEREGGDFEPALHQDAAETSAPDVVETIGVEVAVPSASPSAPLTEAEPTAASSDAGEPPSPLESDDAPESATATPVEAAVESSSEPEPTFAFQREEGEFLCKYSLPERLLRAHGWGGDAAELEVVVIGFLPGRGLPERWERSFTGFTSTTGAVRLAGLPAGTFRVSLGYRDDGRFFPVVFGAPSN